MATADKVLGGTSYYPDHWPQSDWERDMKLIKDSGLDIVRFGEFSWYWYEPAEGKFDFAGYDIFMDLAEKLGLKTVLCTPTAAAPSWMLHKYSNIRLVDQFGRSNQHGRHMVCYNHPKAKELAERAIITLAERYKDHPALYGWQIDNEPTCGESADRNRLYDYHPETVKLFKEYMREKYQDLNRLNSLWQNNFWSRSYSSWDEIESPQAPGIPGLWLDWMRFRDLNVTNLIRWQLQLLRSVKESFFIGTNIPECGYGTVWYGQDYWQQCQGLDYVGTDLYVYNRDLEKTKKDIAFSCDIIRSAANAAGAEFWISETQSGPTRHPWRVTFAGGLWGKEFQRLCVKEYVAHDAKKILFFLWRPTVGGSEFGGSGMVNFDGTPTEISEAIPEIMAEAQLRKNNLNDKPIAYIHHSRDSLLLAGGYDPDDRPWSTIVGWHRVLTDLGYRIEFISDDVLKHKEWSKGEICILPYATIIDNNLSDAIKDAIKTEVKVIAGFATGYFNEYGSIEFNCPSKGLDEYIGVKIKNFDVLPTNMASYIEDYQQLLLDVLVADINVKTGEIILRDSSNKPLMVKNADTYYFAFDFGTLYGKENDTNKMILRNLIQDILNL